MDFQRRKISSLVWGDLFFCNLGGLPTSQQAHGCGVSFQHAEELWPDATSEVVDCCQQRLRDLVVHPMSPGPL